jgi:hypothetical protein
MKVFSDVRRNGRSARGRRTLRAGRVARKAIPAAGQRFGIDTFAKTLGLLGVGVYAVLFLAYQRYYSVLGIRPEEIGVTQLFLLSRSVAFLMLVALPLLYLSATFGMGMVLEKIPLPLGRRSRPTKRGEEVFERVMSFLAAIFIASGMVSTAQTIGATNTPARFALFLGASFFLAAGFIQLLMLRIARFPVRRRLELTGGIMGMFALVGTGIALMSEANDAAAAVQQGQELRPVTLLGLPLLDVESQRVRINWIMPAIQRPVDVLGGSAGTCALLVGKSTTTIFVIPQDAEKVAMLPIASIALRQDPSCE